MNFIIYLSFVCLFSPPLNEHVCAISRNQSFLPPNHRSPWIQIHHALTCGTKTAALKGDHRQSHLLVEPIIPPLILRQQKIALYSDRSTPCWPICLFTLKKLVKLPFWSTERTSCCRTPFFFRSMKFTQNHVRNVVAKELPRRLHI